MCKKAGILQKLIALCSRHGYIHSAVELQRVGANGCYDYGPLGALLRRNIQNEWLRSVVLSQEDMFEVQSCQLQQSNSETVHDARNSLIHSDHEDNAFRVAPASAVDEASSAIQAAGSGTSGDNNCRRDWLLRDSLHQGTFAQYHSMLQLLNRRLPFGLAQIGHCFQRPNRSDPDEDRFIFDLPEFTQMTTQFFCPPKTADRWMIDWQRDRLQWWRKRHYSKGCGHPPGGETSPSPCGNLDLPRPVTLRLAPKYAACNAANPLTHRQAVEMERATEGQALSLHWFDTREKRLTASTFGRVLKRRKAVNSKFLASLLGSNAGADKSAPVVYGKCREDDARQAYVERSPHLHVHACGFVVNPAFSFLGATPDGKVCDGAQMGILEIKCPYSARGMPVKEAAASLPKFYMVPSSEGALTLRRDHHYYYQVQGQLMVTGAPFCDFVVFTGRDVCVERILPDPVLWETMLDKLAQFYQDHAMPFYIEQGL